MDSETITGEKPTEVSEEQGQQPENEDQGELAKDKEIDSDDWKTEQFRSHVKDRIQNEIVKTESQVPKSGAYFEEFAFSKAKSKKQYLDLVAGIVIYISEYNSKKLKSEEKTDEVAEEQKKAEGEEVPSES